MNGNATWVPGLGGERKSTKKKLKNRRVTWVALNISLWSPWLAYHDREGIEFVDPLYKRGCAVLSQLVVFSHLKEACSCPTRAQGTKTGNTRHTGLHTRNTKLTHTEHTQDTHCTRTGHKWGPNGANSGHARLNTRDTRLTNTGRKMDSHKTHTRCMTKHTTKQTQET